MSEAENYQRAKAIFIEACEKPAGEIPAYLDAACDSDPLLRRAVESMLRHDHQSGDLLDSPGPGGPSPVLNAGAQVGRYRVVGVIGEGGMGIVYEAEQDNPRRTVALKVIRPGLASPAMLRRFEHEAQALARLQHPGIAQIYEAGRADGPWGKVAFFAMERVLGTPLLDFAQQQDLTTRQRLDLGARIADAVQHAHQRGVIHRDLKPANILVDQRGQPKILDFGIARIVDDQHAATVLTSAGQIIGTVAYMSPEQAAGDLGAVDTRADIYSLGVVLFELLTGRLPYSVTGVALHEALRVIGQVEPARISSIDRRLRGDVAVIIARALEKDRNRRYQACAELAEDLRRHLRDEAILARPPTAMYQMRKFARRHKAVVAGAAIAVAAMLIGTAVSLRQAAVAVAARKVADEKTLAAERQAVRATIAAATVAAERDDAIAARRLLESIAEPGRAWEWRYLSAHVDRSAVRIQAGGRILGAAVTPDGAEAVTVTAPARLQRWRLADAETVASATLGETPTGPVAFSHDASRLAGVFGTAKDMLGLWDAASGATIASVRSPSGPVRAIGLSPTGDVVAAGGAESFLWEPGRTEGPAVTPMQARDAHAYTFSKDGRRLGIAYMQHYLDYDAHTGRSTHRAYKHTELAVADADMNDDGSAMLFGGSDKRAWMRRSATPDRLGEFSGHSGPVRTVALETGGARALSAGDDGAVRLWDPATGSPLEALTGHVEPVRMAGFGADGRVWAVAGSDLRVWDVPQRDEVAVLRGHTSYVYAVAPLEGGRRIVSGAWDNSLRVWDSLTGEFLATASCSGGSVIAIAVLPRTADRPSRIAAAHNGGRISLWNADTLGQVLKVSTGTTLRVAALASNADGSRLAVRIADRVVVFDTVSWAVVLTLEVRSPSHWSAVAMSADGEQIAADGPGKGVTVWSASATNNPRVLQGHSGAVHALAFSPDGRTLASGSADATVRLWDPNTGRQISSLIGHTDRVYALKFAPEGDRLASGSNDGSVRVWDPAVHETVAVLRGHTDYVFGLAFTPDGATLFSASGDATVRAWGTQAAHIQWRERSVMERLRRDVRPLVAQEFNRLQSWERVASAIRARQDLSAAEREAALQVVIEQAQAVSAAK